VDDGGPPGPPVAPKGVNDTTRARRAPGALRVLRGTAAGLEFVFAGRPIDDAWAEMAERLAERPDFYRGSQATAIFDVAAVPDPDAIARLLDAAETYGIALRGIYGGDAARTAAEAHALPFLGEPPRPTVASFERKRAARAAVDLPERVRSLDADFAGARADIAKRRARGEPSVPRPVFATPAAGSAAPAAAAAVPETLYHRGTLRGGRSLAQQGTIVVVGDVNPGAELVATGDILVFGALRGTAHAGAQGDEKARVFALRLEPTQLRIATYIASSDGASRPQEAEVAFIDGGRIAIAPYAHVGAD
jgi:septum site-determining protein MinC